MDPTVTCSSTRGLLRRQDPEWRRPADLPIEQIRLKPLAESETAKALGITIPQSILIRADEVIK